MANYPRLGQEDRQGYQGDPEDADELDGVVWPSEPELSKVAHCYVSLDGVLMVNGVRMGNVYFKGKASRECKTCRKIKPNSMFYAHTRSECKRCVVEAISVYRSGEYQQDDWGDPLGDMELIAPPLDQMFREDASRYGGMRKHVSNRHQRERLKIACEVLRELD